MIVAVDLETTGLNPNTCQIIECAVVILSDELDILDEKSWVVGASEDVLTNMNEFCTEMHNKSGLVDESLHSEFSLSDLQNELLDFFKEHGIDGDDIKPPLFGNSIGFDRAYLQKYLPQVNQLLSYRNIDVSSLKELVKRWKPEDIYEKGETPHRALDDIKLSIKEALHYKELLF